jgi:hypothetical protein
MSRNTVTVLRYCRHKLLNLVLNNTGNRLSAVIKKTKAIPVKGRGGP